MVDELQLRFESSARVAVELETAGIGNRALAYLIDLGLVGTAWMTVLLIANLVFASWLERFLGLGGLAQALVVSAALLLSTGYDILFEVFADGQTPGKRLVGLRVVRVDGGRVGPIEAALRNLLRGVDMLPVGYGVGIVTMAWTRQQRRLGDLVAGCVVTRERPADPLRLLTDSRALDGIEVNPSWLARARALPLGGAEHALVLDYLTRREQLLPAARQQVAATLAGLYRAAVLDVDDPAGPLPLDQAERLLVAVARSRDTEVAR